MRISRKDPPAPGKTEPAGAPPAGKPAAERTADAKPATAKPAEIGGPPGPEPTRFGDWEKNGRCIDF